MKGDIKELSDVSEGMIVEVSDKHARQFLMIEKITHEGEDCIITKKIYRIVPKLRIEKDRMVATMVVEEA